MAKINSKIDQALRKEVIENGVLLGTVLIFGFNNNLYLYENEVYVEQFKLTDDDYVITDFYQTTWGMTNTNIYNGKFNANEPYTEELIIYMSLYNESLYLSNKKYREIAKQKFAELKKEYEESGLLDDINALLKKSKSKTFRYSKYESEKNVGKSIKESNLPNKVYDVLNELTSNFLLDYGEFVEFERNGLEHHFDKIRELGAKLKKADMKGDDDLYQKIADEIVTVVKRANGTLNESKKSVRKSLKEMFNDDEGIVYDFVDFLIYDCGYDEKTVEKYFYKKYKLNGLDTIPTKLYIKIKNEIEDALGYNDIM